MLIIDDIFFIKLLFSKLVLTITLNGYKVVFTQMICQETDYCVFEYEIALSIF